MHERIELIAEVKPRSGVSVATMVSLAIHVLLTIYVIRSYHPVASHPAAAPIVRYVELMRQNPRAFVEAPGAKVNSAAPDAAFSDANRKAAMPQPTGERATTRPGEGGGTWIPKTTAGDGRAPAQSMPAAQSAAAATSDSHVESSAAGALTYHKPADTPAGPIDWRRAIQQVGESGGSGPRGMDIGGAAGGEKGFAESGPLSFETQWYDWGDYAQSMVSRIRVNWYGNMPQLIRTGMKGVVTIRFTIHRDGQITDVTILNSSGIPPYDAAAAQAIRLSSPLRPLPKDFPNDTERVTCMFYYNMEIPK